MYKIILSLVFINLYFRIDVSMERKVKKKRNIEDIGSNNSHQSLDIDSNMQNGTPPYKRTRVKNIEDR